MRRAQAGFTFLEVTIVVVILGVAAAVGIPWFMELVKPPSRSEAVVQLTKIGKALERVHADSAQIPLGTSTTLPPKPCCTFPENKCPVLPPATWQADPIWAALGFSVGEPGLFQYTYSRTETDGTRFTATAVGDLDCDGTKNTYTLRGELGDGGLRFELVQPPRAIE